MFSPLSPLCMPVFISFFSIIIIQCVFIYNCAYRFSHPAVRVLEMHTLFGTTLDGAITAFPDIAHHYNCYPWVQLMSDTPTSAVYHPIRLVFDADLPLHLRRCVSHLEIDDPACRACADIAIRERGRLEMIACNFIKRCRYFVLASARPLLVASGLKGFHLYFPVIYVSQSMARACDSTIRAMFVADGIDYIDPQVSFEHHITGILSPHRTAKGIRALPVVTAEDYICRWTSPEDALHRGIELLREFISRFDFGIHP